MIIEDILKKLLESNVKLSVKENKLLCKLPEGGIDNDLLTMLKEHKEGIIELIQKRTNFEKYQAIPYATIMESYPLTPSQKRLWVLSQFEGGSQAYNMSFVIKLKGELNYAYFEKAFLKLIEQHEILRTQFEFDDDSQEVRQRIVDHAEITFSIDKYDFAHYSDYDKKIEETLTEKMSEAFSLEQAPLLRASLFKIGENEHVFFLNMHHIITDGWSMEIVVSEVVQYYNDFMQGIENENLGQKIQYKDFAVWFEDEMKKEKYKKSEKYWLDKFSGNLATLTLPSFKQRPAIQTFNGNSISHTFSSEFTERIKSFSESNNVTSFVTLMTIVKALLHRYSNQEDIIVGTPIAGREHPDLENKIGLFVNTLAIRTQFNESTRFIDLLEIEKTNLVEANEHQMYGFDELVRNLNIKKDLSRSTLFDVLIVYQNQTQLKLGNKKESVNDITFEKYSLPKKTSQFDITFNFSENDNQLILTIEYNIDIYDSWLINRIFSHIENFSSVALNEPEKLIQKINYLTFEERNQLLIDFNNTQVDYPENTTVVDLFIEQAQKYADKIAVEFLGKSLTYKELDEQSSQLANYLIQNYDIKPNDLVGIRLDRSEKMILAIFGILKAGAAYIPIDMEYPEDRVTYIAKDAGLKCCIDEDELDKFKLIQGSFNISSPKIENQIFHLAYCIYTSGSTGKPKGVLNHHAGLYNRLMWMKEYLNSNENEVFIQKTPYTFDVSVWELILPFITGSKLVIAKPNGHKDANYLKELIAQKRVTVIHFVPSMLKAFLLEADENKGKSLSHIICSGEELSSIVAQECMKKFSQAQLHNLYGPTEASIDVTAVNLTEVDVIKEGVTIGKPIANTNMYIVNDLFELQPIGVSGELLISGIQVAKGYLNLPELTSERFIDDPFKIGNSIYKTGDIAYWKPDGSIQYLGRIDNQVKIRGNRIELGEIENAIMDYGSITQTVVTSKVLEGEKILVAYYVSNTVLDKKDLQASLEKVLPDYMLPSIYVQLDIIPLTTSGKVDKKSLPEINESDLIKEEYIAPKSQKEQVLVNIWSEILGVEKISIKDNFYNLGGDSIKSILVIARLKQQGFVLKVDQILRNPVLEDLAKLIQSNTVLIDQSEVIGEVPLTPIQHYFFKTSTIQNKHYFNQAVLLDCKEEINPDYLEQSIINLTTHHDALRMVFNPENNSWTQYNQDATKKTYKLSFHDLRGDSDEIASLNSIGQELQSTFDISSGVLFHIGHFKMSDGDKLALIIHHLVVDGVSWRILLEDLSKLYSGYITSNHKIELPLKTDSYLRWSSLLNDFSQTKNQKKERKYWEEVLVEKIPSLPIDFAVNDSANRDMTSSFMLDRHFTETLKTKVNQVYNTDINDVLLTALGLSIQEVFGVEKSLLKMEGHGREDVIGQVDVSRTVGWFTSVYPFVLDVSNSKGYELVKVKDSLRKIPNKGIGYGILNYLDTSFIKEFIPSIQFNYLGDFGDSIREGDDQSIFQFSSHTIGLAVDENNLNDSILLDISGVIVAGELNMSVGYSKNRYEEQTINSLINSYKNHLEILIESLSQTVEKQITPSDLTFKKISFEELLDINVNNNLEDIYELSPLQQGLYYHWLVDKSSPMYFQQITYTLQAHDLKIELVKEAFDLLIKRYSVLRTAFTNEIGNHPLQIVYKDVLSDFSFEKLVQNEGESLETCIEKIKIADRTKGFDLEKPSLMRLKIVEIDNDKYTFIWSHHHILMDGWCISIILRDFAVILNALLTEQKINLIEPVKYSNYIDWLSKIDQEESLNYWKNYLDELESITDIPFKEVKENEENFELHEKILDINGEVYENVLRFCQESEITTNVFIQTIWGYLLSRYNNTQDVVFGSVVSGRPGELEGVEDMIGLFINTIPVRLKYATEDTPRSLVKKVQSEAIQSLNHHFVSLAEVQSQSEFGADLIKTIIVFENYFVHTIDEMMSSSNDNQEQSITIDETSVFELTNYDFTIVVDSSSSLKIQFQYNGKVFNSQLVDNLVSHFSTLINQFISQEDTKLDNIDYVSEDEKEELLNYFNKPMFDYPIDQTIVDLFEKQVLETPTDIAVVFDETELSYHVLNEKANQLAHFLRQKYLIQSDDLIGIKLGRNEWMIIAILGVLKSGAAYVPIDIDYPQERIEFIEKDSKCKFIIDEESLQNFKNVEDNFSKRNLEKINQSNDLAYIIYTSGTTGTPKGVMVEHSSVVSISDNWKKHYKLNEIEVNLLQLASISFDVFVGDICRSILNGGKMIICSNDVKLNPEHLYELMYTKQISILEGTPGLLLPLMEYISQKNKDYSFLKILIFGSDSFNNQDYNALKQKFGNEIKIINSYGVTEATIDSTYFFDYKPNFEGSTPIGKPFSNSKIYIIDSYGYLSPIGVYGEICIGGDGLSRGYFNNDDLTKEKFIQNTFDPGKKMYKTGDLGKWFIDGNIDFIGRKDNQVKIRGYRIELGEIETNLKKYDAISSCVTLVKKDNTGEKYIVAYVVSEKKLNASELIEYLQNHLPSYMIPSHFVQIEALPLTSNGKIDKKSLPDPKESRISSGKTFVSPKNDIEKKIVSIWEEVLGVNKIGVTDNFFELGGHSLLLVQVINRIQKQIGQSVSFATFFKNPTVQSLCNQLKKSQYLLIPKAPEAESYPLTASQSRLWILSQLDGGNLAYNMPEAIILKGNLDKQKFKQSFDKLLQRHEILRTYFKIDSTGEIQQYIMPFQTMSFQILEKNYIDIINQKEAIETYLKEMNSFPFNLEHAPLLRASLLQTQNDEYVFFLTMHHIISDGWSMELFMSEIIKIYQALVSEKEINLPELNIQFKDYALWINQVSKQEEYLKSEQYWVKQFEGDLPVLDLPNSKNRPLIQTYNGESYSHTFSIEFLDKLKSLSKEQEVTLFMTLMAGVNALFYRYTGVNDIILGTPVAGREHPDLEIQIGLYLNTLAIRTIWEENSTFSDLLDIQKETLINAYDNQDYPFDALVEKLNLKRDTSRSALFDVMVILQNQNQINSFKKEQLQDIEVQSYPFSRKTSQFDMSFNFFEDKGLGLVIEYNTDIYSQEIVERMAAHFESIMNVFLDKPDTLITKADYVTDLEKKQILVDFNNTQIIYPENKTVIDLFEEQVEEIPNNIAVIFDEIKLTYQELNEQSNKLANYLIKYYNVQSDDLIGIKLDRSERMVISIFGILKAGAAYVPIDVDYPEERVTFIINDGNLKCCIDENEFNQFRSSQTALSIEAPHRNDLISHLAYCIYTSGSTGNPKGVLNHHAGLYNRLLWMKEYLGIDKQEVFLQKTPYTFDVSVWELILPFITGSTLVMARPEGHKDVQYLEEIIEEKQVSIIHFVPSMLSAFLSGIDGTKCNSLQHIICSGEELSALVAQECKDKCKVAQLHNLYGPTEASIDVTAINLSQINVLEEGVSIGKPVSNTNIYIVSPQFELQPIGVPGELLISGVQVAKGYLNLPELTKDKFISDPFNKGLQVYRTGDVAYWKSDGSIQYMGRMDNQVKIRGNRIELGEIENAILSYQGIQQAVVVPKTINNEKVLVAYYLNNEGTEIDKVALRSYIQEKLPVYMHPSFYVLLESIPMTTSGKVNRKALPNILAEDIIRRKYVAPENEIEEKLSLIWKEVLGIEEIGVEDDFFELGGHSLKIIKLYERIKNELSDVINVTHLFSMTTIRLQAKYIKEKTSNSIEEEKVKVVEIDF